MISVVICNVDAGKFEAVSAHYHVLLGGEKHEVIGIHDAKGMCEGYNRGLDQSRGEIVVFSHDDVEILCRDFAGRVRGHMEALDVMGVAGTDRLIGAAWHAVGPPHVFGQIAHLNSAGIEVTIFGAQRRVVTGMRAMDGVLLAFRREVAEKLRWDEGTFKGFHCYDTDMTFRAALAGYRVGVVSDLPILHHSEGEYGEAWQREAAVFMRKHADKLAVMVPWRHQFAKVQVATREAAVEVMTPENWGE